MDFSFAQFRQFVTRQANTSLAQATGVDVLGNVNNVRYQAAGVGLQLHPETLIPSGSGGGIGIPRAAKPKITKKEKLVGSVDGFLALRKKIGSKPHGGAALLVHALLNWADPATRDMGMQMLVLAMAEDVLVEGSTYKQYALAPKLEEQLRNALPAAAAAARSLVAGTAPAASYSFDPSAVALAHDAQTEQGQDLKSGVFTVHLISSGDQGRSRPVQLVSNKNGVWKAHEFASLLIEVQAVPVTTSAADDL